MIATLARDQKNFKKKNILKGEGTLYVLVHVGPIPTTKKGMLHFENEVSTHTDFQNQTCMYITRV